MPAPRRLLLPALAAVALALLAGCVPAPTPSTSGKPSTSARPPASPSASDAGSPVPTPTPTSTPIAQGCAQLISPDTMYAFNPNFALLSSWTPDAGSSAATAKKEQGVVCRWQNETSGDTIDLSVADLDAATLETLKNQAVSTSTMVPTYPADEGYFSVAAGIGTAIIFTRSYWIVLTSAYFAEPGDAADLAQSVLTALG